MKTNLLFLMMTLLAAVIPSQASDNVILQVKMKGRHTAHSGNDSAEKHQRWLEISAAGMSMNEPRSVTIQWHLFADDLAADNVVEHAKGSETLNLQPGRPMELKTKEVVLAYVREHAERSSSGRRAVYKRIEATGNRYHGWAVQAVIDGKTVGEAYSSRDIESRMKNP